MATQQPDEADIFSRARQIADPEERRRYLQQACGGDATLLARIETLLRAHEQSGNILDIPIVVDSDRTAAYWLAAEVGAIIAGRYKLLEKIGEGGMGTVWVAEQIHPVRRKVALKLVKPGMDSQTVLARFEAERQALALMDHPHIAKVLDGGLTETGRPFFVMEYVKGVPITEYCDQARLSIAERARLFMLVCKAVQHAHQKGIVHRDLKPSNILVAPYDGTPVPKVIDFGLAKALYQPLTEETLHTGHGMIVGTPLYMSPEQAQLNNLDVDTRTDIYSLGVLFYELLTGTTPLEKRRFKEAAWEEVRRIIRDEDPPSPSARLSSTATLPSVAATRQCEPARLTRLVRGELDWIVMKALAKERDRRYETANALARDIERYLHDEPVEARPPSKRYQLRKFLKRHKGVVLAVVAVILTLVAGIVGTSWGLAQAVHAQNDAEQAKETAQAREAETRAVLDFVETRIMAAARPEGRQDGLGHDVTLRLALEAALPVVDTSFRGQPLIEARLRMTLGESFRYLGEARIAAEQYRRARALYLELFGADDPRTPESVDRLAACFADLDDQTEALKLREDNLARRRALLGANHRDTLRSRLSLANSYAALGRNDEALQLEESTVALQKTYLGAADPDTLASMSNLALSYNHMERFSDALQLSKDVLDLRKLNYGPDHPDTLQSMNNLAITYLDWGAGKHDPRQYQEALKILLETLERRKAKLGHTHPDTIQTIFNLANAHGFLEQRQEALKLHQQALDLRKAKFGPDHRLTLLSTWGIAAELFALKRGPEAIAIIDEVLERASHLATQPDLVGLANNRSLYFEQRQDVAGCRRTAELWENLHRTDARSLYNSACYRAVAAKVIRGTDRSPAGAKEFEIEANRAMAWLQQAVTAGYKKVAKINEDSDLDALRDRQDFKKLVSDLDAKLAKEKSERNDGR